MLNVVCLDLRTCSGRSLTHIACGTAENDQTLGTETKADNYIKCQTTGNAKLPTHGTLVTQVALLVVVLAPSRKYLTKYVRGQ